MKCSEETRNRIVEVICDQLGVSKETLTETSRLTDDLDADSLGIISVCMELEEEFGIQIETDEWEEVDAIKNMSVGDIVRLVETKLQNKE